MPRTMDGTGEKPIVSGQRQGHREGRQAGQQDGPGPGYDLPAGDEGPGLAAIPAPMEAKDGTTPAEPVKMGEASPETAAGGPAPGGSGVAIREAAVPDTGTVRPGGVAFRRWLGECLDGLQAGLAPMLAKEMRSRTRGIRSPVLLTLYLLILTGVVTGLLWLLRDNARLVGPEVGLNLYSFFALIMVMLLAFIAPAMAAGAISGEKERRTYDLLMVTRASAAGIVLGKWLASVIYLLWLVLAALPVFAVIYLYGGMPARQVGLTLAIILATGMSYGALGLALSAVLKRSQAATIIAIILVFTLIFGTLVGAVLHLDYLASRAAAAGDTYRQPALPWYVFHSPLPALTSVLPGGDGRVAGGFSFPLLGELLREIWQQFNRMPAAVAVTTAGYGYATAYGYVGGAPGVTASTPGGLAALPFWGRFLINQAVFLFLCLLVAVVAIMPVKPWRLLRR